MHEASSGKDYMSSFMAFLEKDLKTINVEVLFQRGGGGSKRLPRMLKFFSGGIVEDRGGK